MQGKAQDTIVTQTQAAQQSLSGVNLDEEAANLIRYQQAYQASGKVLQVASTLFDTILGASGTMIRISTNTIFEQGVFNLQRGQSTLVELQDQIATGRRVRTPADDPVAAARALEVEQSQAISEQYIRNGDSAQTALGLSENALTRSRRLIQDVRTLAVNAGDGALSEKELKSLAVELRGRYQDLLGLANSTDGNGQYLFSGYQGATRPFAETAPGLRQLRRRPGRAPGPDLGLAPDRR